MDDNTLRALQANYQKLGGGLQMPEPQAEAKPKRSGIVSWLPAIGGTIGSIGGGLLGGVGGFFGGAGIGAVPSAAVGAAGGGAAGGALGEWLAQKLSGESKDGFDKGNILQEGAINGVLGAIPLGKVGQIGKGVIKGAGERVLARGGEEVAGQLLKEGGEQVVKKGAETAAANASKGGIKNWIGSKLVKEADNTALRAAQLSGKKEALKGFEKRFGEDLGTYLRNNKLIGATGKDVEEGIISNLNKKYTNIVSKIDKPITSSDVLAQNMKKGSSLEKLLKSGSRENKQLADDVFAELDHIFKTEGGAISPKRLAELKTEYQTLAKNSYKLGANSKASVNEKVAEYLKKTLQGVSGSDELKVVGQEIDKAYKAADLLASAAQNGRGTLSFGMTDLLAATPGAAIGGLPGAAVAVGAKKAINSPKVQSFIAQKLAQGGEKLLAGGAERAAKEAVVDTTTKGLIKTAAKEQIPGRALQGLGIASANSMPTPAADGGAAMNPNSPFNPASPNYIPGLVDPNAVGEVGDIGSVMGASESPYSLEAMQADVMRDPKNADEYQKIYAIMNPEPAGSDLSQTSRSALASSDNAINTLNQLEELFANAGGGSGRIGGKLKGLAAGAGLDENARVYNNLSQASVTQFAKALAGAGSGTVSDMDAKVILAAIPTISDTKAEAAAKFKALRQRLENAKGNTMQYGGGATSDLQALMMAQ